MNWLKKLSTVLPFSKRERIYIIPNGYGIMYAMGVLVTLLTGAIFTNNLAYILCFFIVSILLAGMNQSNTNLKNIEIVKFNFPLSEENSKSEAIIWIKNNSKTDRYQIKIRSKQLTNNFNASLDYLPAQTLTPVRFQFKTKKYGQQIISKIQISTTFPFGLFFAWRNLKVNETLFIYPKRNGQLKLPFKSAADHMGLEMKNGDDFSEHKIYEQGDSLKNIDWKAYARSGKLLTKTFNEGSNQAYILVVDSLSISKDKKIRQLSKWIDQCEASGEPYKIQFNSISSNVGLGESHKNDCLKKLSFLGPTYE
jgi:uncharacterized protein (DUF58 family)